MKLGKIQKMYHSHTHGEPFCEVWAQSEDFDFFRFFGRSLCQVNLLFSDYEIFFEKIAKVAIVDKYESYPLSIKTKIKFLG